VSGLDETRRDANATQECGELTRGCNERIDKTYQRCLEDRKASLLILRPVLEVAEPGSPPEGLSWMGFHGQRQVDLPARRRIDHQLAVENLRRG